METSIKYTISIALILLSCFALSYSAPSHGYRHQHLHKQKGNADLQQAGTYRHTHQKYHDNPSRYTLDHIITDEEAEANLKTVRRLHAKDLKTDNRRLVHQAEEGNDDRGSLAVVIFMWALIIWAVMRAEPY